MKEACGRDLKVRAGASMRRLPEADVFLPELGQKEDRLQVRQSQIRDGLCHLLAV